MLKPSTNIILHFSSRVAIHTLYIFWQFFIGVMHEDYADKTSFSQLKPWRSGVVRFLMCSCILTLELHYISPSFSCDLQLPCFECPALLFPQLSDDRYACLRKHGLIFTRMTTSVRRIPRIYPPTLNVPA